MTNKVYVDKARLLGRVIIISWATLILCFIVKIFGGNFFEIMSNNENYKALCEYADTHLWLDCIIAFASSLICQSLYLLSIIGEYKFSRTQFLTTIVVVALDTASKYINPTLGVLLDVFMVVILPMLFLKKDLKKYIYIPIGLVLILAFQVISLLARNLGLVNVADSYFVGFIYSIDVYIMLVLYYLYRNTKKERKTMGKLWVFFMGAPTEKLRKMRDKRVAKIAKLEAEKNAIEIELSNRKNEK